MVMTMDKAAQPLVSSATKFEHEVAKGRTNGDCVFFGNIQPLSLFVKHGEQTAVMQLSAGEYGRSAFFSQRLSAEALRTAACAMLDAAYHIENQPSPEKTS